MSAATAFRAVREMRLNVDLLRRIARAELSAAEVLTNPPVEALAMPVGELLASQPGWGAFGSRRVLFRSHVSARKSIGALTPQQRLAIIAEIDGWCEVKAG